MGRKKLSRREFIKGGTGLGTALVFLRDAQVERSNVEAKPSQPKNIARNTPRLAEWLDDNWTVTAWTLTDDTGAGPSPSRLTLEAVRIR